MSWIIGSIRITEKFIIVTIFIFLVSKSNAEQKPVVSSKAPADAKSPATSVVQNPIHYFYAIGNIFKLLTGGYVDRDHPLIKPEPPTPPPTVQNKPELPGILPPLKTSNQNTQNQNSIPINQQQNNFNQGPSPHQNNYIPPNNPNSIQQSNSIQITPAVNFNPPSNYNHGQYPNNPNPSLNSLQGPPNPFPSNFYQPLPNQAHYKNIIAQFNTNPSSSIIPAPPPSPLSPPPPVQQQQNVLVETIHFYQKPLSTPPQVPPPQQQQPFIQSPSTQVHVVQNYPPPTQNQIQVVHTSPSDPQNIQTYHFYPTPKPSIEKQEQQSSITTPRISLPNPQSGPQQGRSEISRAQFMGSFISRVDDFSSHPFESHVTSPQQQQLPNFPATSSYQYQQPQQQQDSSAQGSSNLPSLPSSYQPSQGAPQSQNVQSYSSNQPETAQVFRVPQTPQVPSTYQFQQTQTLYSPTPVPSPPTPTQSDHVIVQKFHVTPTPTQKPITNYESNYQPTDSTGSSKLSVAGAINSLSDYFSKFKFQITSNRRNDDFVDETDLTSGQSSNYFNSAPYYINDGGNRAGYERSAQMVPKNEDEGYKNYVNSYSYIDSFRTLNIPMENESPVEFYDDAPINNEGLPQKSRHVTPAEAIYHASYMGHVNL